VVGVRAVLAEKEKQVKAIIEKEVVGVRAVFAVALTSKKNR
jgi:hypothetical protein